MALLNEERDEGSGAAATFLIASIIWLSVAASFSTPNAGLDKAKLFKIGVRAYSVLVLGWLTFSHLRSPKTQRIVLAHIFWIAFVAWAIASTFWSPLKSITLGQAGGLAVMLLLSIGVALNARTAEKYLRTCLVAIVMYCAIYGVGSLLAPGLIEVSRSSDRSLVHPTALGATSSLGILLNVGLLISGGKKLSGLTWISLLGIPVMLIALVVSHNRLSLGLVLVLSFAALLAKGKTNYLATGATFLGLSGLVYVLLDPGLILLDEMFGSSLVFFNRGQSTHQLTALSGRAEMWTKMWASYLESPMIGHGYFVCSKTGKLFVWFQDSNHTAHNVYLQALVSTGVIGLSLFGAWCLHLLQMLVSLWFRASTTDRAGSRSSQDHRLNLFVAALIMTWFLGWTALNSSILGPVRPETVLFATICGVIVGRFDLMVNGPRDWARSRSRLLINQTPNSRRAGI